MHLVMMTRGINQQVDLWKKFMETQMFPFPQTPLKKDKDGKFIKKEDGTYERGETNITRVQGALRPIQLWEYIVPEQSMPEVLAMLNQHKKADLRPGVAQAAWALRKMMGLKPVDQYRVEEHQDKNWYDLTSKYIPTEAVATYLVGIKEDITKDFVFSDTQGFYQEGL